jgi:hypothetical protein
MLIDRFNFGRRRREHEEQKTDLRQCKRWNARSWWEPRIPRTCRPSTVRQEKFRINKKKVGRDAGAIRVPHVGRPGIRPADSGFHRFAREDYSSSWTSAWLCHEWLFLHSTVLKSPLEHAYADSS